MLRFKKLKSGYAIIENGKVYTFDKTGKITGEGLPLSPEYVNGAIVTNYVSVLSSGKRTEVAIFHDDAMDKFTSALEPQDCVMKAYSLLKPLCFLRKNGKSNDVNYNQAVFICNYVPNLESDLQLTREVN